MYPTQLLVPVSQWPPYYPVQPAAPFSPYSANFTPPFGGEPTTLTGMGNHNPQMGVLVFLPSLPGRTSSCGSRSTSKSRRTNRRTKAPPPTVYTGSGGALRQGSNRTVVDDERMKQHLERERRKRKRLEMELQQERQRRKGAEAQLARVEMQSQLQQEPQNPKPKEPSQFYEMGVFQATCRLSLMNGARTKTVENRPKTPHSALLEGREAKPASKPALRQRIRLERPPSSVSIHSCARRSTLITTYTMATTCRTKSYIPTLNLAPLLSRLSLISRN
ncbi:hypothetical protein FA15DRAFT_705112 [Coprinopsis marcescibilis]|uniref:Uncharacterized protein n=1 Tax=Coprinopsis marcescibilis TaxID=230819 RepID=A0A5C3KTS4_COPMA|nr:hypothetical protein FA15DRAFT_705112 [Coprinopsis marcescibilis]